MCLVPRARQRVVATLVLRVVASFRGSVGWILGANVGVNVGVNPGGHGGATVSPNLIGRYFVQQLVSLTMNFVATLLPNLAVTDVARLPQSLAPTDVARVVLS